MVGEKHGVEIGDFCNGKAVDFARDGFGKLGRFHQVNKFAAGDFVPVQKEVVIDKDFHLGLFVVFGGFLVRSQANRIGGAFDQNHSGKSKFGFCGVGARFGQEVCLFAVAACDKKKNGEKKKIFHCGLLTLLKKIINAVDVQKCCGEIRIHSILQNI